MEGLFEAMAAEERQVAPRKVASVRDAAALKAVVEEYAPLVEKASAKEFDGLWSVIEDGIKSRLGSVKLVSAAKARLAKLTKKAQVGIGRASTVHCGKPQDGKVASKTAGLVTLFSIDKFSKAAQAEPQLIKEPSGMYTVIDAGGVRIQFGTRTDAQAYIDYLMRRRGDESFGVNKDDWGKMNPDWSISERNAQADPYFHLEIDGNLVTAKSYQKWEADGYKSQLEARGYKVRYVSDPIAMNTSAPFTITEQELWNLIDNSPRLAYSVIRFLDGRPVVFASKKAADEFAFDEGDFAKKYARLTAKTDKEIFSGRKCPECGADAYRFGGTLGVKDPTDKTEAWCNNCGWHGTYGDYKTAIHARLTKKANDYKATVEEILVSASVAKYLAAHEDGCTWGEIHQAVPEARFAGTTVETPWGVKKATVVKPGVIKISDFWNPTATAQKVMDIAGDVWDKNGWMSADDVDMEVLKAALKGIANEVTLADILDLEDSNFHSEIKALYALRPTLKDEYNDQKFAARRGRKRDHVMMYSARYADAHGIKGERFNNWVVVEKAAQWDDEESEEFGREEDDIYTEDGNNFFQDGKQVVFYKETDTEEWYETLDGREFATEWDALEAHMKATNYYPNVWFVSDHGNEHLMTKESKKTASAEWTSPDGQYILDRNALGMLILRHGNDSAFVEKLNRNEVHFPGMEVPADVTQAIREYVYGIGYFTKGSSKYKASKSAQILEEHVRKGDRFRVMSLGNYLIVNPDENGNTVHPVPMGEHLIATGGKRLVGRADDFRLEFRHEETGVVGAWNMYDLLNLARAGSESVPFNGKI